MISALHWCSKFIWWISLVDSLALPSHRCNLTLFLNLKEIRESFIADFCVRRRKTAYRCLSFVHQWIVDLNAKQHLIFSRGRQIWNGFFTSFDKRCIRRRRADGGCEHWPRFNQINVHIDVFDLVRPFKYCLLSYFLSGVLLDTIILLNSIQMTIFFVTIRICWRLLTKYRFFIFILFIKYRMILKCVNKHVDYVILNVISNSFAQ